MDASLSLSFILWFLRLIYLHFCVLMCIRVDCGLSFSSIEKEVLCITSETNRINSGLNRDRDLSLVILVSNDNSFLYKLCGLNKKIILDVF